MSAKAEVRPRRLFGRRVQMMCAYCGHERRWRDDFPTAVEALCWTCWLRQHPEKESGIRSALAELDDERLALSCGTTSAERGRRAR